MAQKRPNKRETLTQAATRVAYTQGASALTLASLAEEAGVPLGSIYYYFKTRDDVVGAVVETLEQTHHALTADWDGQETPAAALRSFVAMSQARADDLAALGCPVGTLTAHLGKEGSAQTPRAGAILTGLADWAAGKFEALGLPPAEARREGRALLVALEGAAMMAHAGNDPSIVTETVETLTARIDHLAARLN